MSEMSTNKTGDVERTNTEMSKMGYSLPKPKKGTSMMRKPKMAKVHARKMGR